MTWRYWQSQLYEIPQQSGDRFGEKWCQSVYHVAAIGTRKKLVSWPGHLGSTVCVRWCGEGRGAWGQVRFSGKSVFLRYLPGTANETRDSVLLLFSQSASLNCHCRNNQNLCHQISILFDNTSDSNPTLYLQARTRVTWCDHLISTGPAMWKRWLSVIWWPWK